MDKLIDKIKSRERSHKMSGFTDYDNESGSPNKYAGPPRACVDYRYLKDKLAKQTSEELKTAKSQAKETLSR